MKAIAQVLPTACTSLEVIRASLMACLRNASLRGPTLAAVGLPAAAFQMRDAEQMSETPWSTGSVVRLKSGGEVLRVIGYLPETGRRGASEHLRAAFAADRGRYGSGLRREQVLSCTSGECLDRPNKDHLLQLSQDVQRTGAANETGLSDPVPALHAADYL